MFLNYLGQFQVVYKKIAVYEKSVTIKATSSSESPVTIRKDFPESWFYDNFDEIGLV